jgi:hypothetical protein
LKNHQPILIYILSFLALSILLKILGVIDYDTITILGYAFIFYGISAVYLSFGKGRKLFLFFGTFIFLVGLVMFLVSNFEFGNIRALLFPAILLIIGISMLMIYIDGNAGTFVIVSSAFFIAAGIMFTYTIGEFSFNRLINSILSITLKYWPVILIVLGIIFLIKRNEKSG